jgi:hypothetical protein
LIPWLEAEPTAHLVGHGPVQSLVAALDDSTAADVQVMTGEALR